MIHEVVLFDPKAEFWPGAVVKVEQGRILQARGCQTIPIEPELCQLSGAAGLTMRYWGGGIPLSPAAPKRLAPLTLYCRAGHTLLHWRARLLATGEPPQGSLRIAVDTAQVGIVPGAITMFDNRAVAELQALGEPDTAKGWNVGGAVRVSPTFEGFLGLMLYGAARGACLVSAALSQTSA